MNVNRNRGVDSSLTLECPPVARSQAAAGLTVAALRGCFELQVCGECRTVQYPPREACYCCLSLNLEWRRQSGEGELISETVLHYSYEAYFRQRLPWRIGMVRLDCGPTVIAHLDNAVPAAPCLVRVVAYLDEAGQASLVAMGRENKGMSNAQDSATGSRSRAGREAGE